MKKIIFTIFAALPLVAAVAQKGYRITGVAEGTEKGDTVYLCEMQGFFNMVPLDTAYVGDDGKFVFKGNYNGAANRIILPMKDGKPLAYADFLLENADYDMQLFKTPNNKHVINGGGEATRLYAEYNNDCKQFDDAMEQPWKVMRDSTLSKAEKAVAQAKIDSIEKLRIDYTKQFIAEHIPSAISDMLFAYTYDNYTPDEQEAVLKKMGEGHHYIYYNQIMAERKADAATAVGEQYTDLAMLDPNGKMIKVSDYVSEYKYTLVDFWASWCGPCRAEMPNVVKAYTTYHSKGFQVVGVSFDNNKKAWVDAIGVLKMPWPQMSDLKGWGCAAASAYNIKGIPANVLVDKNGKIVAKNLRGEDLQKKLAALF